MRQLNKNVNDACVCKENIKTETLFEPLAVKRKLRALSMCFVNANKFIQSFQQFNTPPS